MRATQGQSSRLVFHDHSVGRFPKESWTWVHVWSYEIAEPECPDNELLQCLIEDESFAYSYVAPHPDPEVDGVRVHGPFRIEDLSIADFTQTEPERVTSTIEHFLNLGQAPHSLDEMSISTALSLPISVDTSTYELKGSGAFHRMGRLIGDYSDFVLISGDRKELKEVVLGFD
jgi:hypothetical protein